jgi:pimeloyl-ACP methyl ester carboxylesterase
MEKTTLFQGIRLNYLELGKGRPILFLHGGGTRARTCMDCLVSLSRHFRVIAPDIPGFGGSGLPTGIWSFREYAAYFSGFMRKLRIKKYYVMGYSFGGGIAYSMSPDMAITKTILLSPIAYSIDVSRMGLLKIILKEAIASFVSIRSWKELGGYLATVRDFLSNQIMKANRIFFMADVAIKCFGAHAGHYFPCDIYLVEKDSIVSSSRLISSVGAHASISYVEGTHLWPIMKPDQFCRVAQKYAEK